MVTEILSFIYTEGRTDGRTYIVLLRCVIDIKQIAELAVNMLLYKQLAMSDLLSSAFMDFLSLFWYFYVCPYFHPLLYRNITYNITWILHQISIYSNKVVLADG